MSKHGLSFYIEGAAISVDEMGEYVARYVLSCESEHLQEQLAHDIAHGILGCVTIKVNMAQQAKTRAAWMSRHPPNHAGFYYCHLCGGWVHQDQAELDEIEPRSYRRGEDPLRDENRRMAHAWPVYDQRGKELCAGNRGKGSRQLPSATMEIAPPDEEC